MPGFYPIYYDGKEVNPKGNVSINTLSFRMLFQKMEGDIGSVKEINF